MPIPLFVFPIVVGLIAQGLKPLLNKQWDSLDVHGVKVPRYGGMPSAHTAFAFSLATVVAVSDGIMSGSFAIAVAILLFILDDALRMRVFLGKHGEALARLIAGLPEQQREEYPYLETRLGHKPAEVIAGAILGIAATLLIMWPFGLV